MAEQTRIVLWFTHDKPLTFHKWPAWLWHNGREKYPYKAFKTRIHIDNLLIIIYQWQRKTF